MRPGWEDVMDISDQKTVFFREVSKAFFSSTSMLMWATVGDRGEPTAAPSTCL